MKPLEIDLSLLELDLKCMIWSNIDWESEKYCEDMRVYISDEKILVVGGLDFIIISPNTIRIRTLSLKSISIKKNTIIGGLEFCYE